MTVQPIPEGYHTITPYLVVDDVDALVSFLQAAFNATSVACVQDSEGRTSHAELKIGNSMVMLGQTKEGVPTLTSMLYLYVADTDAVYRQAIAAGGVSLMGPSDQFYGDRNAAITDAYGNQWWIATRIEALSLDEIKKRAIATEAL